MGQRNGTRLTIPGSSTGVLPSASPLARLRTARQSHREMRPACLPVCEQSLHAAVEPSDSLWPGLSWLSFCSCHLSVYEKGVDATASSGALLCGSDVGSRRWCRRSRHRTPVTRHQSPPSCPMVDGSPGVLPEPQTGHSSHPHDAQSAHA